MDRYPAPALEELPEDMRQMLEEHRAKVGLIPSGYLTLARRPAEFRAFFAYYSAVMDKETGNLTRADRELIITATSARNNCLFCVVAHGAILRVLTQNPRIADQVVANPNHAELDDRQRAILTFAFRIQDDANGLTDEDFDAFKAHGFDDEDAWDVGAVVAFFALSNRMAGFGALRPNDEFYLMGRVPREFMGQLLEGQ